MLKHNNTPHPSRDRIEGRIEEVFVALRDLEDMALDCQDTIDTLRVHLRALFAAQYDS